MKCFVEQEDRFVSERLFSACDVVILNPDAKTEQALELVSTPEKTIVAFCKTDHVLWFFRECEKRRETKYILVTHNSDYSITTDIFLQKPPNIVKWYGQNIDHFHPILESIPIGSHVATWIGDRNKVDNAAYGLRHPDFVHMPETDEEKKYKNLAYMDFGIWTNSEHRKIVYQHFKDKPWVTAKECGTTPNEYKSSESFVSIKQQCQNIYDHKFVISPIGNGYDCGRNWLSMYLGSIPVIPWHKNIQFYTDMPIVVYKDIEEVTEDFLLRKYDEISISKLSLGKSKISYWSKKLLDDKNNN